MYKEMAEISQIKRGIVWCTQCGRQESVEGEKCLQKGWPKCCGYTMTIDSPEERRAMTKDSQNGRSDALNS